MNFYPVPLSSTHSENKSSRIAFVLRGVRYFERWSNYVTHVALYRYRTPDWAWRVSINHPPLLARQGVPVCPAIDGFTHICYLSDRHWRVIII